MAVTLKWDKCKDIEIEETLGVYTRVLRVVMASGLTPGDSMASQFQALESAGLPTVNTPFPGRPALVLRGRRVRHPGSGAALAEVFLEYVAYHDVPNGVYVGSTQINQFTTATDIHGTPITLDYTFVDDPRYGAGSVAGPPQGAEAQVDIPSQTLRSELLIPCNFPSALSALWTGAVNMYPWAGYPANTWCCVSCTYDPHAVGRWPALNYWRMTWTFQTKLGGWDPVVWYKDPDTGNPVPNLVPNQSIKQVDWYTKLDYYNTYPYFRDY